MKILIVEDRPETAELLADQLSGLNAEIEIATTLAQLMVAIRRVSPDMVLLDIFLPDSRSPEDTLSHIRLIKQVSPNAVVIVITGLPITELGKLAISMGADGFYFKMDIATQGALLMALKKVFERYANCSPRQKAEMGCQILERLTELTAA